MRCALAHDLVHLELWHAGNEPSAVEEKVWEQVARSLVPIQALYAHRQGQGWLYGLAEDLGVTEAVLMGWLHWLTKGNACFWASSSGAQGRAAGGAGAGSSELLVLSTLARGRATACACRHLVRASSCVVVTCWPPVSPAPTKINM